MEVSHHLFHTSMNSSKSASSSSTNLDSSEQQDLSEIENMSAVDMIKRKIISDTCHGINDKTKVLNLHSKKPADHGLNGIEQSFGEIKVTGIKKPYQRYVNGAPERVLDAPDFKNDYCKCPSWNSIG
jgi:hypothetical protein